MTLRLIYEVNYDNTGVRLVKIGEVTAFLFTDGVLICDYPEKGSKLTLLHFLLFDDLRLALLAQDMGMFKNFNKYLLAEVRNGFELLDKDFSLCLATPSLPDYNLWIKELGPRIKVSRPNNALFTSSRSTNGNGFVKSLKQILAAHLLPGRK